MADETTETETLSPVSRRDARDVHFDVHVHVHINPNHGLPPRADDAAPPNVATRAPAPTSRLASAALVIAFAAGGAVLYKTVTGGFQQTGSRIEGAALAGLPPPRLAGPQAARIAAPPASLASELQQPPVVTPAPGAAPPGSATGPASFGLN